MEIKHIQSFFKAVGNSGCYALCLVNLAQKQGKKFDIVEALLLGIEKGSVVAVGTVGVLNDEYAKKLFLDGFREMVKRLEPKEILVYGNRLTELDEYKNIRWFEPFMNKFNKKKGA